MFQVSEIIWLSATSANTVLNSEVLKNWQMCQFQIRILHVADITCNRNGFQTHLERIPFPWAVGAAGDSDVDVFARFV